MKPATHLTIIFLVLFFCLSVRLVNAATEITTIGEAAVVNITPEEAQKLALNRARNEAINQVCGVQVQSETLIRNFSLQGDFIHAVSYGRIIAEEIIKWELDVTQENLTQPPQMLYRVTLRSKVQEEQGKPDPFYKVRVWLNKKVFISGEEMIIHVSSTKEGYLTVLNFSADDSVTLLYPNKLNRDNRIEANRDYQIPSPKDCETMSFKVAALPGHKRDTEYIRVISTRGPINMLAEIKARGNYGVMDSIKFALTEIARLLAAIPPDARAEDTATYQIINPSLQ